MFKNTFSYIKKLSVLLVTLCAFSMNAKIGSGNIGHVVDEVVAVIESLRQQKPTPKKVLPLKDLFNEDDEESLVKKDIVVIPNARILPFMVHQLDVSENNSQKKITTKSTSKAPVASRPVEKQPEVKAESSLERELRIIKAYDALSNDFAKRQYLERNKKDISSLSYDLRDLALQRALKKTASDITITIVDAD